MIEVTWRKPHWDYWMSLWCLNRSNAYYERNRLRRMGYHAEVI